MHGKSDVWGEVSREGTHAAEKTLVLVQCAPGVGLGILLLTTNIYQLTDWDCMCVHIYLYVYVCVYIHAFVCIYMWECMSIHACAYVYNYA